MATNQAKRERPLKWYDFKVKLVISALTLGTIWNLIACPTWVLVDKNLFQVVWKPITLAAANFVVAVVLFIVITPKTSFVKAKLFGAYKALMAFLGLTMLGATLYAMVLNSMTFNADISLLLTIDLIVIAVVSIAVGIMYFLDWILYRVPAN